jgi:dTDP-4-amino-4,6-dideoxygalactose transaminase
MSNKLLSPDELRESLERDIAAAKATVSPHQVTREFEAALCDYTGAKYAVTTTSCTMAILMAAAYWRPTLEVACVRMPKRSYIGVPASLNAGFCVHFDDTDWRGEYRVDPLPVWDSARRFTSGMFRPGAMQCVSFHWGKILGLSQGGAILHDNDEADAWLRRARFDGRTEGVDPKHDQVQYPSWHAYLSPEVAAHGLMKLSLLPAHNDDLPNSDYPDLSLMEAFK